LKKQIKSIAGDIIRAVDYLTPLRRFIRVGHTPATLATVLWYFPLVGLLSGVLVDVVSVVLAQGMKRNIVDAISILLLASASGFGSSTEFSASLARLFGRRGREPGEPPAAGITAFAAILFLAKYILLSLAPKGLKGAALIAMPVASGMVIALAVAARLAGPESGWSARASRWARAAWFPALFGAGVLALVLKGRAVFVPALVLFALAAARRGNGGKYGGAWAELAELMVLASVAL
jgi:cobalamin synthase